MKKLFGAMVILLLSALGLAGEETWQIDKMHTSVSFDVGHLGISTVRGFMSVDTGSVKVESENPAKAQIEVKMDVNSLNTGVNARDAHLKGDDFLSVEKFPYITFKSVAVREDKTLKKIFIDGDLTIKNITKRITLTAQPISDEVRLPKENTIKIVRATAATAIINRHDFGVDYGINNGKNGIVSKLVDGGISREIKINIFTELYKTINT